MAATGPTIPTNPLELLTPDLSREEPFINSFWGPAVVGTVTFVACCFGNFASKRPVFSGIHMTMGYTAAGAFVGKYFDDMRKDYFAERDAVLRHYIQLHPEDFPEPERKKFSEVLEKWVPIR